ncbi:(2Fe-2S)-binding protein [Brevibacillus humidisoli]|uniref:2Fe-2S iron-sulfur cluster-binding protein n=1 Tax=Brevibacillus humidisoli TaxID=2895522 RepID=UPI001E37A8DB|nr:2Fe-2S iron-sulfur cluster-binding protein [Brevibacillus humidisoli]UFJ39174.1 (2Fe-2S)-binding protein [Brevibacillus humidisoli]
MSVERSADRITVTIIQHGVRHQLHVKRGDNLLMAMVRAKFPVEYMCTTGKCTTCRMLMEVPPESAAPASETERYRLGAPAVEQGYRLACQLYVEGPLTVCLPDQPN